MKTLFTFFILFFSSVNHLYAKNYISGFSIDEMSLGDSALRYYSLEEIKKYTENIYEDDLYTQFTIVSNNSDSEYDSYQIHYKLGDKNYIIEVISGVKWTESFDQCKKLKEKIKKELSIFFSIEKTEWIDQAYENDAAETNASFFYFDNGDSVDIQCKDWNSTVEFRDNLRVSLWSAEFDKFITSN